MDLSEETLARLHERYLSVMQEGAKPRVQQSDVFRAVVRELKSRGFGSLTTIERALAAGGGR